MQYDALICWKEDGEERQSEVPTFENRLMDGDGFSDRLKTWGWAAASEKVMAALRERGLDPKRCKIRLFPVPIVPQGMPIGDVKTAYRSLFCELADLLWHLVPLADEMPRDEYYGETYSIISRLGEADSPDALAAIMREVFVQAWSSAKNSGEKMAGPVERYRGTADLLWESCRAKGIALGQISQ